MRNDNHHFSRKIKLSLLNKLAVLFRKEVAKFIFETICFSLKPVLLYFLLGHRELLPHIFCKIKACIIDNKIKMNRRYTSKGLSRKHMAYSNGVILGEFNKGIMYKILAGLSETNKEHESIIKLVARGD